MSAQQLAWEGADMIERTSACAQKHQLNRSTGAPIAPETLVKRGDVAVRQGEVAFDIEIRHRGRLAYRRSSPSLPIIVWIAR